VRENPQQSHPRAYSKSQRLVEAQPLRKNSGNAIASKVRAYEKYGLLITMLMYLEIA
jgi:hypothetical protein